MVRLVKGAYWDSEIKRAPGARAAMAIRCSRARRRPTSPTSPARASCWRTAQAFYPAVRHPQRADAGGGRWRWRATRAISSSSACTAWARRCTTQVVGADKLAFPCRIYAPVGSHEDLLAYLVRRLLENGANTSFVNRIVDERLPVDEHRSPIRSRSCAALRASPHPRIPLPARAVRRRARRIRGGST